MALIGQVVSEKKIFENDGRRRTPDHGHPISSPCEPNGSGELKIGIPLHTPVLLYKSGVQGGIHFTDRVLTTLTLWIQIRS